MLGTQYTVKEAREIALRSVDRQIDQGVNPNTAIFNSALKFNLDQDKLEALYIERGREGDGGGSGN